MILLQNTFVLSNERFPELYLALLAYARRLSHEPKHKDTIADFFTFYGIKTVILENNVYITEIKDQYGSGLRTFFEVLAPYVQNCFLLVWAKDETPMRIEFRDGEVTMAYLTLEKRYF